MTEGIGAKEGARSAPPRLQTIKVAKDFLITDFSLVC